MWSQNFCYKPWKWNYHPLTFSFIIIHGDMYMNHKLVVKRYALVVNVKACLLTLNVLLRPQCHTIDCFLIRNTTHNLVLLHIRCRAQAISSPTYRGSFITHGVSFTWPAYLCVALTSPQYNSDSFVCYIQFTSISTKIYVLRCLGNKVGYIIYHCMPFNY